MGRIRVLGGGSAADQLPAEDGSGSGLQMEPLFLPDDDPGDGEDQQQVGCEEDESKD